MTDPVKNIIVLRVRYSIPKRVSTFQLILTYYKNEVHTKETGVDKNGDNI